MLKGEAKTKYQREYMRRYRAAQQAAKPSEPASDTAALARARIAELEREVAAARATLSAIALLATSVKPR
jgi:hypothetical protein